MGGPSWVPRGLRGSLLGVPRSWGCPPVRGVPHGCLPAGGSPSDCASLQRGLRRCSEEGLTCFHGKKRVLFTGPLQCLQLRRRRRMGFGGGYRVLCSEAERRKRRASAGHKVSGWGAQAAIKSRRYGELVAEPQLPVARYQDTDTEREFLPTDTKIPKFFPSITCSSWALASQSSTEVTVSSPSFQHTLGCVFRSSHSYRKPGVPMTG